MGLLSSPVLALAVLTLYMPPGGAPSPAAIHGRVVDDAGIPLPGVLVEAEPYPRGRKQIDVTNTNGYYRLPVTTSGWYIVTFKLEGMNGQQQRVHVSPANRVPVDVVLRFAAVTETITVTAPAPVIDTTNVSDLPALPADDDLDLSLFRVISSAIGWGVFGTAPIVPFRPEIALDGSVVPESVANGGRTTGEGVSVISGGIPADFRGGADGIVMFVSSNQPQDVLRGEVRGRYASEAWRSDERALAPPFGIAEARTEREVYAHGGGPVIPEHLWVFGKARRSSWQAVQDSADGLVRMPAEGDEENGFITVTATYGRLNLVNRLSHANTESEGLIGSFLGRRHGDAAALTNERFDRQFWDALSATVNTNRVVLSAAGELSDRRQSFQAIGDASEPQNREVTAAFFETRSPGFLLDDLRRRSHGVSARATGFLHDHELDGGGAAGKRDIDIDAHLAGGRIFDIERDRALERFITAGGLPVLRRAERIARSDENVYAQAKLRITNKLAVNAGARWERLEATGPLATFAMATTVPRLSAAYDVFGNGRSRLHASYSRYDEELPDEELLGLLTGYGAGVRADDGIVQSTGPVTFADPDLRPRTSDEVSVSYSQDIGVFGLVGYVSASATRRELRTDIAAGPCGIALCIGNPSRGLQSAEPRPHRSHRAIELEAGLRTANPLRLSYTYSETAGNVEPRLFPQGSLPVDPYLDVRRLSGAFNGGGAIGPLRGDRRHHVTLNGGYQLEPFRLSYSTYWLSGAPRSRLGYSDRLGDHVYLLGARGAAGRTPSLGDIDAAVEYHYAISHREVDVFINLTVTNLLDSQRALLLDERWSFREADNARDVPANPHFGQPLSRTMPRQMSLGLRIEF